MQINSTEYKSSELNYIRENGNYLLKLIKWEQDGYSAGGELKIKVTCEAKKITDDGKLDGSYNFDYPMYDGVKAGFTIARLRDALQSPQVFNLDDWMNRFVIATISMEESSNGKSYAQVKAFQYSKFNDKLPPFQEIKAQPSESKSESVSNPSEDMTEDELPF